MRDEIDLGRRCLVNLLQHLLPPLSGHPAVAESGVVGVPHEIKGEAIVCFVVLRPGHEPGESLRRELPSALPPRWQGAQAREGALRARSAQDAQREDHAPRDPRHLPRKEPGDLSSLENPAAVRAVAEAR